MGEIPKGLHVMQYGLHILEFELGWPSKGNSELMADCLAAIGKTKKLSNVQAYKYMLRAIKLAKEQGVTVDRMFFMNGEYAQMRPPAAVPEGRCDAECRARHGRGYHTNDVQWVMVQYFQEVKAGGVRTPEYFFKELDRQRQGGPPEWKR